MGNNGNIYAYVNITHGIRSNLCVIYANIVYIYEYSNIYVRKYCYANIYVDITHGIRTRHVRNIRHIRTYSRRSKDTYIANSTCY